MTFLLCLIYELISVGRQQLSLFSGRHTPSLPLPLSLCLLLSWYFCLSLLLAHTHRKVVSVWCVDRQPLTHSLLPLCVACRRALVCAWAALTDSVWVCDRGCQRGVREMCLVSHSADLISGRTVHSGPAVAPYITPAVIHTPAWRDPPPARARAHTNAACMRCIGIHTRIHFPSKWNIWAGAHCVFLTVTLSCLFPLFCSLIYATTWIGS